LTGFSLDASANRASPMQSETAGALRQVSTLPHRKPSGFLSSFFPPAGQKEVELFPRTIRWIYRCYYLSFFVVLQ